MLLLQTFPLLSALAVGLIKTAYAKTVVHDGNFIPDATLRVTSGNRNQSCVPEKEILLVNGTSPGQAGEKYCINTYRYFRPKMVIILLFFLYIILYKF
jgi:hypothetical protein